MACRAQHAPSPNHPDYPCGIRSSRFPCPVQRHGKNLPLLHFTRTHPQPFDAGLAWHRPLAWSVDILEQAVHLFRGTHDFTAFAALRGNEPRPIPEGYFRRTITQTQVAQTGEHVFITFTGTGFLYKMVRLMTGAAHEAARGKITLEELARLINAPLPDDKSPFCAPPDGLTLMRVHYPEETFGDKKKIN